MYKLTDYFDGMLDLISITRVQRALEERVKVVKDRGLDYIAIDGEIIGPYYKHGLVSIIDLCESHLSDDDLILIAK